MTFLKSKVADHGYTNMLERFARECPNSQFVREFTKNCIQAILRYRESIKDPNYKGIINIDINWEFYEMTQFKKISFIDNGIGMTGEEMLNYVKDLASSSDVSTDYENYGFGAKVSAVTKNKMGIVYDSWKDGKGHRVIFKYNEAEKAYGIEQQEYGEEYVYFVPISDDFKPKIIKENGTRVTLLGNRDTDDTYSNDYYDIKATTESWVLNYLNKRFISFPENIDVSARIGHYRDLTDTRHNYLASAEGLHVTLKKHILKTGTVKLQDVNVVWSILKEKRDSHGREFVAGHTAVIHEGEVFDISLGVGHKARDFGIIIGYKNIVLHIEANSKKYIQNTTRDRVILKGEEQLPWDEWQNEFKSKMPKELNEYIEDQLSKLQNEDNTKKIRDKLKDLTKHFTISRYKKSAKGKFLVNEEDLIETKTGRGAGTGGGGGGGGGGGNGQGTLSTLLALDVINNGTIPAVKVRPDPFPEVLWVDPEEDSNAFDEKEIIDRAAIFTLDKYKVFANSKFQGFIDIEKHFMDKYATSVPGENISKVVKEVFEQQFMETIAGAMSFRNRKHWLPEQFEKSVSPEALTTCVCSRYYFFDAITRRLTQLAKAN
ncbi:ATP-binding protein [Pelagibacteraceae bacterium]|nr:ATP-binding protein [Pelagibacteraceae bacterium]